MKAPKIITIPEKMKKFYGSGNMLHPDQHMVEELVGLITKGSVATLDTLTKELANRYGANVTCPMRTVNHLKRLSRTDTLVPFWRVLKTDGTMIKLQRYEYWATVLEKEGLRLEITKSNQIKILTSENQLFRFVAAI